VRLSFQENAMKVCSFFFALALLLGPLAGCQQTTLSTASPGDRAGEPAIDPLSRNITEPQAGSLRDSLSLSPPPVRRTYVEER
jgi:hypothetical protein